MTLLIGILQSWGRHRLSKKFFKRIPAFWQKNVRCTVEGKNQNENLHLLTFASAMSRLNICPRKF